jgi:hypothetical protein
MPHQAIADLTIDQVRIYQREGEENLTCDPPNYPTSQYVKE